MSKRVGSDGLDRLEFRDGSFGGRMNAESVRDAAAGSWEYANAEVDTGIAWTVDDLDGSDDPGSVSVEVGTLAELLRLARIGARYAGCTSCERVTLV